MKKITLLLVAIVTTTISSYSQTTFQGWTVKAGVNLSSTTSESVIKNKYKTGFTAGLALDWLFTDVVGLSADVLYSRLGTKADLGNGVKIIEYSNYINVPVMANFYIVEGLALKAGVQLGWFLSAGDEITGTDDYPKYDMLAAYNMIDVAIPVGISYEFNKRVSVELRYHFGVTNIVKETPATMAFKSYNRYASLTVGYRF